MEYDDNDFGGRNPVLNSGESLPVLSTYSLPNYDFEESLQGDIRFDSLVETRAYHGIGCQEDTTWMDDFSRRIESGTGDVEPGSVLRENNVWSEAKSLESVEMLLESVGQEDVMHGEIEVQDCSAGQELGSSTMQLVPDGEERDCLIVKDVSSYPAFQVHEEMQELSDHDAVNRHPVENVHNVSDKTYGPGSGNNVDSLLHEVDDAETLLCSVTNDTQAMNKNDCPSVENKPELNQIEASCELQKNPQVPAMQSECLVNWPQISEGLDQGYQPNNPLNQVVKASDIPGMSNGGLNDDVEGIDYMAVGNEYNSNELAAEITVADSEKFVSSDNMDMISGDEASPKGTSNDQLISNETYLGAIDTSNPVNDCKCKFDKHVDSHAFEESNVTLEDESVFAGCSAESTNPNSGAFCDENKCSLATSSASVQKNSKLCEGPEAELTENPEKILATGELGDGICAFLVEKDESCGGCELMENTVTSKKPDGSVTKHDELLWIPSDKMDSKLVDNSPPSSNVCSSALLASVPHVTEDTHTSEVHISNDVNITASVIVQRDTMESDATPDITDGIDRVLDVEICLQSYVEASRGGDNVHTRATSPVKSVYHTQNEEIPCVSPSANRRDYEEPNITDAIDKVLDAEIRLQSNIEASSGDNKVHIRGASSIESVYHTKNEETPCVSPSANRRDYDEPEKAPLVVSNGGESKDDTEIESFIQRQSDISGTAFTSDVSVRRDSKASDAADNDKTFSFMIASSAECSERETVNLWQPFTPQVPVSSQNVNNSPLTPVLDQINLGNQESFKTTNTQTVTGSNKASVRKPRKTSRKTSNESAKRESRKKQPIPSKLRESNVFHSVESGVKDLNHSYSLTNVHRQHFTELHRLQLRAQIFVYGSLIQGTAPDEACMVAAFGGPEGGRSLWESARQRCLERIQNQKSQNRKPETPSQKRLSSRTSAQQSKISKSQAKSKAVPPVKGCKSTQTPSTISILTPPASPLWTLHTPDHVRFIGTPLEHNAHSQSYPHSSIPMAKAVVHMPSWSPQPAPWVASPQTAAGKASPSSLMNSKMKPVKLTPISESSTSVISVRHPSPCPASQSDSHNKAALKMPPPLIDDRSLIMNSGQTLSDSKTRKRKKAELIEGSTVNESKFELASAACVSGTAPATVATPNSDSKLKTNASTLDTVIASSGDHQAKSTVKTDDRIFKSNDMCSNVDEAQLHAEDAAACSVATEDLSQKMWSQLVRLKDSGITPDVEAKIVSAALAISAALAVAKAAAAAAKVASDAAMHAKLMAEKATSSSRTSLIDENEVNGSSSLTTGFTVLEETDSAAVKPAKNLILKAAELAAEAVTRAGKVAMIGNPLPLCQLVNAGPEGCWKLNFGQELHSNTAVNCHGLDDNDGGNTSRSVKKTGDVTGNTQGDCSLNYNGDLCKLTSMDISSNIDKPIWSEQNPIEGSTVEIYKEGDGVKAAWFSANVLELKNGEAYVRYTESFGDLKEWIKLDVQGNEAPKIRAPHPMTAMPSEGTRKRRREEMGKCLWSVGDRVDAWRQSCWWEGVIVGKSNNDDTAFTVHFSAQGEISIIKACHLRPSLIWQDGKWSECSSSMSNDGDSRQEKRMKLCDPGHEVEGIEKASGNIDPIESKIQGGSQLMGLSDNEKAFNVGKSNKDVRKPVIQKMVRIGLQNEGIAVASGVPKPERKRKFMDVSQHSVSRDSKTNENNVYTRRAKMLNLKGSGLPGWKNSSRIDLQEKKVPAIRPKVPNSKKPPAVLDRTLDKNSVSSAGGVKGFAAFSIIGTSQKPPFEVSSTLNESTSMLTSTGSKSELYSKIKFDPPSQKLGKIEENSVYKSTAGTSYLKSLEPRRSNRRIQPTSRLLEGLQTSLSTPKIPSASHEKGLKSHGRNGLSRGNR